MNYRHGFHAGNFADVHKHAVLARTLLYLRRKPAPFRVIDTHAGGGRYDLFAPEPSRSGEWREGIERVWEASRSEPLERVPEQREPVFRPDARQYKSSKRNDDAKISHPALALLAPYLAAVAMFNRDGRLRVYPGSPLIVQGLLRERDRLIACELEPQSAAALAAALRGDRRAKVLALDGWMALDAGVPPRERRGLVLIDPPFEEAADFVRLSHVLGAAYRKWPTGIYLMWYPIKQRAAPDALARRLRSLAIPKMLRCELTCGRPDQQAGLRGSGLIVVNPPFTLEPELRILMPALCAMLSPQAASRLDWLAHESASRRSGNRFSVRTRDNTKT